MLTASHPNIWNSFHSEIVPVVTVVILLNNHHCTLIENISRSKLQPYCNCRSLLHWSVLLWLGIAIRCCDTFHWNASYSPHYITRQCVAVHFAGSCSLQLTDGKNSTLFCPISYRNISDILQQNVTSTQPLCVGEEHKYIPKIVWCICQKMGSTGAWLKSV